MNPRAPIPVTAPLDESDDSPLHSFWWLKRIVIFTSLFITFVSGSWLWLNHRAERRLAAEIQEWKREGLPIEPEDFEQPPVPDEQNAAVALNHAVHAITDMTAWEQSYLSNDFGKYPWNAQTLEVAEDTAAVNYEALHSLRAARKLTRVRWDVIPLKNFGTWNGDPHRIDFTPIRALANIIRTAALAAHQRGDDAAFLEYLHDLQFIAETTAHNGNIVSRLIACGIDSLATEMTGIVAGELRLETPALRAEARARMVAWSIPGRLPSKALTTASDATLLLEFLLDLNSLAVMRTGDHTIAERLDAAVRYGMKPNRTQFIVDLLSYMRRLSHAAHQQNWPAASRELANLPRPTRLPTGVEPLGTIIQVTSRTEVVINDRYLQRFFQNDLHLNVAILHLACRLYAIDHGGQNPTNLAELVPDYLPVIPVDRFDANGKTFLIHTATTQPFFYALKGGPDLVAKGTWMPTIAQHEDFHTPIFVSFLNPHPGAATTQPAVQPVR